MQSPATRAAADCDWPETRSRGARRPNLAARSASSRDGRGWECRRTIMTPSTTRTSASRAARHERVQQHPAWPSYRNYNLTSRGGITKIDIVRPSLARAHRESPRESAAESKRDSGLAELKRGRGMMRARALMGVLSDPLKTAIRAAGSPSRRSRTATMSPTTTMAALEARSLFSRHALQGRDRCASQGRRRDHRRGALRRPARAHQCRSDAIEIVHHHVEHDRRSGARGPQSNVSSSAPCPAAKMIWRHWRAQRGGDESRRQRREAGSEPPGMMRNGTPAAAER